MWSARRARQARAAASPPAFAAAPGLVPLSARASLAALDAAVYSAAYRQHPLNHTPYFFSAACTAVNGSVASAVSHASYSVAQFTVYYTYITAGTVCNAARMPSTSTGLRSLKLNCCCLPPSRLCFGASDAGQFGIHLVVAVYSTAGSIVYGRVYICSTRCSIQSSVQYGMRGSTTSDSPSRPQWTVYSVLKTRSSMQRAAHSVQDSYTVYTRLWCVI